MLMKTKAYQIAFLIVLIGLIAVMVIPASQISAQDGGAPTEPAGTRVPPTLVPAPAATATPEAIAMSGIKQIQDTDTMTVGTLYNAPPFTWLDEQGDVVGYEPEVLRAVAADLGVSVEFVQVTSETAIPMLLSGEIDMVIGTRIHSKDAEAVMEFSHTYFYNRQLLVVRADAPYGSISDLANQRVSVVAGSEAEEALNYWISANNIPINVIRFLTEGEALDALASGDVEAMAGPFAGLRRAGRQGMRFLDPNAEALRLDPYGIAFRRYDINLRNAINRAIQRLAASGRLDEIAGNWFDEEERSLGAYFSALIPVYADVAADTRAIDDFPPDIRQPEGAVLEKIRNDQQLTVAGLSLNDAAPVQDRFLDPLGREIMYEMGRRWGVDIVFLPDTYNQGQELITGGQADIAIGVEPRWEAVDRVEYTIPYHYRSDKIIVLDGSRFRFFTDLRGGQWIGYFSDDPADGERLEELKEFFNTSVGVWRFISENQAYEAIFGTRNVQALYGDSIRLQAFMEENSPDIWRFLSSSRGGDFTDNFEPIVMAVPRGESDFLTLVNWTLGEMAADGTLQRIWEENYLGSEGPPFVPYYQGDGAFLYEQLGE